MSQITGSSISLAVGGKLYLLSYVSMGEWETFSDMLLQGPKDEEALEYLIYCSMYRADLEITKEAVAKLLRKHSRSVLKIVDKICKVSLPPKTSKKEEVTSKETKERNLKSTYRILSRMHGWTPKQISEMSPAQVISYLAGGETGTGLAKMTGSEYRSLLASRGMLGKN